MGFIMVEEQFVGGDCVWVFVWDFVVYCKKLGVLLVVWFEWMMWLVGLEVYMQSFFWKLFFLDEIYECYMVLGINVYGILWVLCVVSIELFVFIVFCGFDFINSQVVGLLLVLVVYFWGQIYWVKDIVFLVIEYDFLGIEVWFEVYYDVNVIGMQLFFLQG